MTDDISSISEENQAQILFEACTLGRTDIVQRVLQANENSRFFLDEDGASLLHYAVFHDNLDVVRALLRSGVPTDVVPDGGDFRGKIPLELDHISNSPSSFLFIRSCFTSEALQSVMLGDLERTEQLLNSGVNLHDKVGTREDDKTLLEWAQDLDDGKQNNNAIEFIITCSLKTNEIDQEEKKNDAKEEQENFNLVGNKYHQISTTSSVLPIDEKNEKKEGAAVRVVHGSYCDQCGRDVESFQNQIEEKDALIERLRQMLQDMAEEQEVLRRLVHKQGSTSLADHFHSIKIRVSELEEELIVKSEELDRKDVMLTRLEEELDREAHIDTTTVVSCNKLATNHKLGDSDACVQLAPADINDSDNDDNNNDGGGGDREKNYADVALVRASSVQLEESLNPCLHVSEPLGVVEDSNELIVVDGERDVESSRTDQPSRVFMERQSVARPDRGEGGVGWWRWSTQASPQKVGRRLVLRV